MTAGSTTPGDLALNRREPSSMALRPGARPFLAAVCLGAIALLSPATLRTWVWGDGALLPARLSASSGLVSSPAETDLDGDGLPERLDLTSGRLSILSNGGPGWQSPAGWAVRQATFTDLNRDGRPEVSLLVWREFRPWPTVRILPHGGRIDGFHDALGRSCHLILIGPDGEGGYRELWAGSALADPIVSFVAVDLDRDTRQELVTLENRYADDPNRSPGRSLKVWEWNGFGFTAMDRVDRSISRFVVIRSGPASQIVAQVTR